MVERSETGVRRARASDWAEFRGLRLRALQTDPLAFGSTFEREEAFPPEKWKERLTREIDSIASATWFGVDSSDALTGMIAFADLNGAMHVFATWVDPRYRLTGVGGRLLDAGLAWASEHHPGREIVLDVNPNQVDAVRLYESRGFRPTGTSAPLEHAPSERTVAMVRSAAEPKPRRG